MCTITYIPNPEKENSFFVTDNRDESVNRPAKFPEIYREYGASLYYPKDLEKGGTWFGVSDKKRMMCLMNGAFSKYKRKPPYRKSRGVVVKELLAAREFLKTIEGYDFEGIEPFFGLVFFWEPKIKVFELVWDGYKVYLNNKNEHKAEIWSSAMSYSKDEHAIKAGRFKKILKENEKRGITPALLWGFHHSKEQDQEGGLIINRGLLQTTSVSQFYLSEDGKQFFRFHDLVSNREGREEIMWDKR